MRSAETQWIPSPSQQDPGTDPPKAQFESLCASKQFNRKASQTLRRRAEPDEKSDLLCVFFEANNMNAEIDADKCFEMIDLF